MTLETTKVKLKTKAKLMPKVKQFAMTLETRNIKLKTKDKALHHGQNQVRCDGESRENFTVIIDMEKGGGK